MNDGTRTIPTQRADDTVERWLPVVGWEGCYEVSDRGRVKSVPRFSEKGIRVPGRIKAQTPAVGPNGKGIPYLRVGLCRDGEQKRSNVHALVAEAFLGPRPPGFVIRHLDLDHANNAASNLIYGTYRQNGLDTVKHGRNAAANKTHCKWGHEFDLRNTYVSSHGHRRCRACARDYQNARSRRTRTGAVTPSS